MIRFHCRLPVQLARLLGGLVLAMGLAMPPPVAAAVPVVRVLPAVQPAATVDDGQIQAAGVGGPPRLDHVLRAGLNTAVARPDPGLIRASRAEAGNPPIIGMAVPLADLASPKALDWYLREVAAGAEGRWLGVRFRSPGAQGIRLGLLVEALPADLLLAFYAAGQEAPVAPPVRGDAVAALLDANRAAGDLSEEGRTYWSPVVPGEEAVMLLRLPPGLDTGALQFTVPRLSHLFADPLSAQLAAPCHLDVSCESDGWRQAGDAVAKMVFTAFGNTFTCTGSLLNDVDPATFIPYFITANHCISTQTAASTLQTHWFYQTAACGAASVDPRYTVLGGGAVLLYSSDDTDTSFLRLQNQPPAGATYLGWSNGSVASGTAITGIHHPTGDLKKIGFGETKGLYGCTELSAADTFGCFPSSSGNFIRVDWSEGTVEPGSSGSGLLREPGILVGTLFGGNSSCFTAGGSDYYGRFDLPYNEALHQWLAKEAYNMVVYRHSDKCQDVRGGVVTPGAEVIQWPCHGGDNQRLALRPQPDGYYSLVYRHSGQCTDVAQASSVAGGKVIQWPCHGGDNQLFTLEDQGDGYYSFRYKHSGQCVDVFGADAADGANVIQWPCHGQDNQLFRFQP